MACVARARHSPVGDDWHQLAGSAYEERTCCHCTTEKRTVTTTGIASTSAQDRGRVGDNASDKFGNQRAEYDDHPATPPAHGSASTKREARTSAIGGCTHVVHTHPGYGSARLDMRP